MLELALFVFVTIFSIVYAICIITVIVFQGIILSINENSTCFGEISFNEKQIKNSIGKILPMEIIFGLAIGIAQLITLICIVISLRKFENRKFFEYVKERFWYAYSLTFVFVMFSIPTRFWIELGSNEWHLLCKPYKLLFIVYILQLISSLLVYMIGLFFHSKLSKSIRSTKKYFDNENYVDEAPNFYAHATNVPRSDQYVLPSAYPGDMSVAITTRLAGIVESPKSSSLKTFSPVNLSNDNESEPKADSESIDEKISTIQDSMEVISSVH